VLILIAVASAQIIRFGIDQQDLAIRATDRGSFTINYTALSLVLESLDLADQCRSE